MAIKYNPYGWEIRPNKQHVQDQLDEKYKGILMHICQLAACLEGRCTADIIDKKWEIIRMHQAALNDDIYDAIDLRAKIERMK